MQTPVAAEAAKPVAEWVTPTAEGKPAIADNSAELPVLMVLYIQREELQGGAAAGLLRIWDRSAHMDAPCEDRSDCPARYVPSAVWTAFGVRKYPPVLVLHGFPGHQIQALEEHCTGNLEPEDPTPGANQ